jgi:hypothetical protein
MTNDQENAHRPLPVILRPVADELLSSWLVRHAAYYGLTGSFFAKWLMLGTRNLSGSVAKDDRRRWEDGDKLDPISFMRRYRKER